MSGRREKYPSTYTTAGVKRMLARLLPPGPIWESTTVLALVEGLAGTWRRLMVRVADALREMRGGRAEETLAEWERELGLPVCPPGPSADADRRASIAAALAGVGGQTPAYFVALALAAGAVVTLEEGPTAPYTSFECGVADINNELGLGRTRYIWRVTFGLGTTAEADALTRCLFERYKPSHTLIEWVGHQGWMQAYLLGDGSVWAEAAGAMTGIAAPWTRVVVARLSPGLPSAYGVAGFDVGDGIGVAGFPDSGVRAAIVTGSGTTAISASGAAGSDIEAIALTGDLTPILKVVRSSTESEASGSTGTGPTARDDIQIGKSTRSGYTSPLPNTGGRIYADLVITGAAPTVAELRALLTTPPWHVWDPSRIARCYLPALARTEGADDIIPDVAQAVGGPLAPVNAVIQAGDLDDIVHL